MSEHPIKAQLEKAKHVFDAGEYSAAEEVLRGMSQDDPKVRDNLIVVQYVQGKLDNEKAIAALAPAGLDSKDPNYHKIATPLPFEYMGRETAVFNRAVIYARSGLTTEAIMLLRSVLEIAKDVTLPVLTHCLCLFNSLTLPAASLGCRPRSKVDEELIRKVLDEHMSSISESPELLTLVTAAFADSSNLHEVFKASASNPIEQTIYLNNLGVFSLNDGKANVAALCFTKAQQTVAQQSNTDSLQHSVTYNAGLCALLREDYEEAIRHFLSVQDAMRLSPVFWVRFTEAAVGAAQRLGRQRQREEYEHRQRTFSSLIQSGKMMVNIEFMLLPGAMAAPGPAHEAAPRDSTITTATEQLAVSALQNALFLLIPQGHTFASAMDAFPQNEQLLTYCALYWVALELFRRNYLAAAEVGQELLRVHDRHSLPPCVRAALLTYLVESLIHLNDPQTAMNILRKAPFSTLVSGAGSESIDVAQRSRVEALLVNLAVTHILSGAWKQAHTILDSLLPKLYEAAPERFDQYKPERDVIFVYQLLSIFLELAQGNQEKALDLLSKVTWSL